MSAHRISSIADLEALVGREIGSSSWVTVDQAMIDAFAEVTGDRQWIHVDRARAELDSPFGSTIAHGFLVLALAPRLTLEVLEVDENHLAGDIRFGVNYGLDRVRFISPLPAGGRIRAAVQVLGVEPRSDGGQFALQVTFELEGSDRPVAVAHWLQRVYS